MNIRDDALNSFFYAGMLSQEQKESLYTLDSNLASMVIGIHRVSGKELSVGSINITGQNSAGVITGVEIHMLNTSGFPVIEFGKKSEKVYYIQNMYIDYKVRGKNRKIITSTNPNRLVRLMKSKLLLSTMLGVAGFYMDVLPKNIRGMYRDAMRYNINYLSVLSGIEQFELLKVILANKSTADVSDTIRSTWENSYNNYIAQENKIRESRAELSEVFGKEVWAIYNSSLGFVVGTVRYDNSTKRFTQVMPYHLYPSIEAISDKNVRDELMTVLIMCRTNRDQDPALVSVGLDYAAYDKDRLIPVLDRAYINTQSGSYYQTAPSMNGGLQCSRIFLPGLFMVPR